MTPEDKLLTSWPDWARWIMVLIGPVLGYFVAYFALVIMYMFEGGYSPTFDYYATGVANPLLSGMAAVIFTAAVTPSHAVLVSIYALVVVLGIVAYPVTEELMVGEYIQALPLGAALVGGGGAIVATILGIRQTARKQKAAEQAAARKKAGS